MSRLELVPRLILVNGDTFVEEFEVRAVLTGGRTVVSQWSEVLTYGNNLVTSLRLYFDPLDFSGTLGTLGHCAGAMIQSRARRGLEPYELIGRSG